MEVVRTKKKKNQKDYLITALLWLLCTVLLLSTLFIVESYNDYGEPKYMEYTFEKAERGSKWQIYVYVKEESNPLTINELLTRYELSYNYELAPLSEGDRIFCYVTDTRNKECSYDLVALKGEEVVLFTLENYFEARKQNTAIGFVFMPILSAVSLTVSIAHFVLYFIGKLRKR